MSKSLRTLMVVTAVFVATAMALTGCQNAGNTTTSAPAVAATTAAATADASKAPASAEAVTTPVPVKLEAYQIDYFMLSNGPYPKMGDIDAALSKVMTEKFNATLKTTMIAWGDWTAKVTTRLSSGDKIDVVFTADWYGYSRDITAQLFSPLNELLAKDAPETVATLGDQFVKGSQVNGINYGVPTEKELCVPGGMIFNKVLVDKYGFDITKITKEEDLEPMLAKIKTSEPNIIPYLFVGDAFHVNFFSPASDFGDAIVKADGVSTKAEWAFANAEYVTHFNLMRKWYKAGYIHPDAALDSFKYGDRLIAEGWFATSQPLKGNNIKADELGAQSRDGKLKLVEQTITNKYTYSNDCGGSMLAIPVTSKDPDRAMMFINLIHTDKAAVNLLAWGIEGVNYTKVAGKDNIVSVVKDNGYTSQVLLWTLGSQFLHFVADTENPDKMNLLKSYAQDAKPSILLGFRYSPEKITDQKAAYDNISKKYSKPIRCGAVDPATELAKFTTEAKAAGLDTIMADVQGQIDTWLAAQKK